MLSWRVCRKGTHTLDFVTVFDNNTLLYLSHCSPTGQRRYYFDRSDEEAEEEEKEEGGATPVSYHSRYRYSSHMRDGDREDTLYETTS